MMKEWQGKVMTIMISNDSDGVDNHGLVLESVFCPLLFSLLSPS